MFLANYAPKCQMSCGSYGPIFSHCSDDADPKRICYTIQPKDSSQESEAQVLSRGGRPHYNVKRIHFIHEVQQEFTLVPQELS